MTDFDHDAWVQLAALAPKPRGRPKVYDQEVAYDIAARVATGESLYRICDEAGMPAYVTIYRWRKQDPEFRELLDEAREANADRIAREIIEIADDAAKDAGPVQQEDGTFVVKENKESIARTKERIEARKWYAAKALPRKYGEVQPAPPTPAPELLPPTHVALVRRIEDHPLHRSYLAIEDAAKNR